MSILKIRSILQTIINNIDSGNSNATEEELNDVIDVLTGIMDKNVTMTKYASCKYMHMSRSLFDKYIREGLIPRGKHEQGGTLRWNKKDLDNSIKLIKDLKYGNKRN